MEKDEILDWFGNASLPEIKQLLNEVQSEYGIRLLFLVGDDDLMTISGPGIQEETKPETQQKSRERPCYLVIEPYKGKYKTSAIKEVKAVSGMGLKEAKRTVEYGGTIMKGTAEHLHDIMNKMLFNVIGIELRVEQ